MPDRPMLLAALLLALAGCGSKPSEDAPLQRGTALPPPGLGAPERR